VLGCLIDITTLDSAKHRTAQGGMA
jgi:hypothetical protein